jgi:hypothetical protein
MAKPMRLSTPISLTLTRPIAGLEHLPLILSLPLKSNSLPYAVHIALVAVGFYAVISMLSISQGFLLPMIYAFIMAILISPVVDKMERHGVNRALSTLLVMLVVTALIVGLIALLSWQLSLFSDQWPELKERSKQLWDQAIGWSARNLNISKRKMNAWLAATSSDMMEDNRAMIGTTITSLGEALATIFLTPCVCLHDGALQGSCARVHPSPVGQAQRYSDRWHDGRDPSCCPQLPRGAQH